MGLTRRPFGARCLLLGANDPLSGGFPSSDMLGGIFHGHAGIHEYFREFTHGFEEYQIESSESRTEGTP
jgi:hypothetical protein